MKNARTPSIPTAIALLTLLGACGDGDGGPVEPPASCVEVVGTGQTEGTIRALVGSGDFTFDGAARPVHVGVYLNGMRDISQGRKALSIVYQFTWPNGDMMLTEDDVVFDPQLEEDLYAFEADLTIKDGKGLFAGMEGERPFSIDAEVRFGPPPPGSNMPVASEEFRLGGMLCDS